MLLSVEMYLHTITFTRGWRPKYKDTRSYERIWRQAVWFANNIPFRIFVSRFSVFLNREPWIWQPAIKPRFRILIILWIVQKGHSKVEWSLITSQSINHDAGRTPSLEIHKLHNSCLDVKKRHQRPLNWTCQIYDYQN